jgi:glycosyltransferase involved in cell wall biosynthesis
MPLVSILTVSQYSRLRFLRILAKQLERQTSLSIHEWVIVDGSKTVEDQDLLSAVVASPNFFPAGRGIRVRYVSTRADTNKNIGHLRNVGNDHVKGPLVVVMDDDDYYPPDRVVATIRAMKREPSKRLAGCCNHLIYEPDLDLVLQFTVFAPNHTVNCCMAYHIKYTKHHRYDDTKSFAEEDAFTRNFTEPMVAIDPMVSVVQMCHPSNTYNKRELIFNNLSITDDRGNCVKTEYRLADLITDPEILADFRALFPPRDTSPYDVVVYCGHLSIVWDPTSTSLGGSEQAVVQLTRCWHALGYTVAVYGRFPFDSRCVEGVLYEHWSRFRVQRDYATLILWRLFGMHPLLSLPALKATRLIVDLHDNLSEGYTCVRQYIDRIDTVAVKSAFHARCLAFVVGQDVVPPHKLKVVPNGIRVEQFSTAPEGVTREPYRFCYCSCYTRGVLPFLKHTWPIIRALEPRAEFHMYYGRESIKDQAMLAQLEIAINQPGVIDHGRCGVRAVVEEKYRSSLHVYFTSSLAEIDCISIRESLVAGCIPVLSRKNLFGERDGMHVHLDPDDAKSYILLAREVLTIANRPDLETLRARLRESSTILTWEDVAASWCTSFAPVKKGDERAL